MFVWKPGKGITLEMYIRNTQVNKKKKSVCLSYDTGLQLYKLLFMLALPLMHLLTNMQTIHLHARTHTHTHTLTLIATLPA